jgi:hypothetical protein
LVQASLGDRVGDRFVLLVTEPAVDLPAGDVAGGVVPVLTAGVGGVERVNGVEQHRRQAGVLVVRAKLGKDERFTR